MSYPNLNPEGGEVLFTAPVVSAMDSVDTHSSRLGITGETSLDLTSAPQVEMN
jgi:hypothetical protein